jgi:hypothetical protein
MKHSIPWFLLVLLFSFPAHAQNTEGHVPGQDRDSVPNTFLRGKHMKSYRAAPGGPHASQKLPNAAAFSPSVTSSTSSCTPQSLLLSCVDSLVNFTGQFQAAGVYSDGTPRKTWEYSMVGRGPSHDGTTTFKAPVIPVTIDMRNADGTPRFVITNTTNCPNCKPSQLGKKVRLISSPDSFVHPFLKGPEYASATYSSSPVPTQITDAVQRAEFGNKAADGWHTLMTPLLRKGSTMALPGGTYHYSLNNNGSCCAFVLVDEEVFSDELFPPTAPPDDSTVIGQAEVSGAITTKDISTFFFANVFLYSNDNLNDCCILGFHTFDQEPGDSTNGNRTRFYVFNYSSWISPGLFSTPKGCSADPENCFLDVTAHSHEIAETFNDPFVGYDGIHNITPFWLNPAGQCQDIMEVGDVIEDLSNPTVPVKINGFTYHPQTEALLPWFAFQSPSTAIHGAYSYPNETALTALSAPQPLNCGGN